MKTLHRIIAFMFAMIAGWCIQVAGNNTSILQIFVYAQAVFWAGLCFAHMVESFKENK